MTAKKPGVDNRDFVGFSDGELDGLLGGFESMVDNSNDCELEEIAIDQSGWGVILHFDNKNPRVANTQEAKDFWKLEQWAAIGLFEIEVNHFPATVVALKYDENCLSKKFSEEQLMLFKKYRPSASAPLSARGFPGNDIKKSIEEAIVVLPLDEDQEYEELNLDDGDIVLEEVVNIEVDE